MEETDKTNMDVDKDTAKGKVIVFHTDINFDNGNGNDVVDDIIPNEHNGIVTDVYNDDVLDLTDLFPN